jgi:hypothetical protein
MGAYPTAKKAISGAPAPRSDVSKFVSLKNNDRRNHRLGMPC